MTNTAPGLSWARRRSLGRAHLHRLIAEFPDVVSVYAPWRGLLDGLGYAHDPAFRARSRNGRKVGFSQWVRALRAWGVSEFARLPPGLLPK